MDRKEFQKLAASRVLLLDGAAGSNFLLAACLQVHVQNSG